ncbi:MAG: NAD-dependent deacylase [Planctomycetes bacterium]|nr:NAD-dependent deacylase [Planctomycetota bacterium]
MKHFIFVLTGAGVSADSGIVTFRGAGGLWEGYKIEDVATPMAWKRDPALVWRFYQMRRAQLPAVQPNDAHRALARLEIEVRASGHGFALVTQNVDNLHERAGSRPVHMHGELARFLCEQCGLSHGDLTDFRTDAFRPCPKCKFPRVRPDIVWFGEVPYRMDFISEALASTTIFISIGTSGAVDPAAGFLKEARSRGARTIVHSLDEPGNLSSRDEFLPGNASEVVPRLVDDLLRSLS